MKTLVSIILASLMGPTCDQVHVPQPTQEAACDSDQELIAQKIHHALIPFVFAFSPYLLVFSC